MGIRSAITRADAAVQDARSTIGLGVAVAVVALTIAAVALVVAVRK